jgi:hypothetical protein
LWNIREGNTPSWKEENLTNVAKRIYCFLTLCTAFVNSLCLRKGFKGSYFN